MNSILIGFIVYLCVVLVVGILAYRRTHTQEGFILGGRKLGPWVIAFSERASGESAWLLIGLPGAAYAMGFLQLWTAIGCCTGILFSWTVIAKRLRQEVGRTNSLTLPGYFQERFPETRGYLRLVSSLIITFFFTFYVAAQFNAAGKVLDTTFGDLMLSLRDFFISGGLTLETTTIGMLIGALIVLFYTAMGGFVAVAWTDVAQGILMVFTCVVLPMVGLNALGGWEGLAARLHEIDPDHLSLSHGTTGQAAFLGIIGGLSWGLGYMGQPHLLTRFMAIRRATEIRTGSLIAMWWAVPAFWGAFLIGIIGLATYGGTAFEDPERLMPILAQSLMPGWLAGIMISGAIAAMMSTADSQLLVTTSTLSEDVYHKMFKQEVTPERLATISRLATLTVGGVAFILAVRSTELVYTLVSFAWAGLSAAFGPALLLTLWWKRVSGHGVLAGMAGGALTVILWKMLGWDAWLTERVSGYVVAMILVVGVSLLKPPPRTVPPTHAASQGGRS